MLVFLLEIYVSAKGSFTDARNLEFPTSSNCPALKKIKIVYCTSSLIMFEEYCTYSMLHMKLKFRILNLGIFLEFYGTTINIPLNGTNSTTKKKGLKLPTKKICCCTWNGRNYLKTFYTSQQYYCSQSLI